MPHTEWIGPLVRIGASNEATAAANFLALASPLLVLLVVASKWILRLGLAVTRSLRSSAGPDHRWRVRYRACRVMSREPVVLATFATRRVLSVLMMLSFASIGQLSALILDVRAGSALAAALLFLTLDRAVETSRTLQVVQACRLRSIRRAEIRNRAASERSPTPPGGAEPRPDVRRRL